MLAERLGMLGVVVMVEVDKCLKGESFLPWCSSMSFSCFGRSVWSPCSAYELKPKGRDPSHCLVRNLEAKICFLEHGPSGLASASQGGSVTLPLLGCDIEVWLESNRELLMLQDNVNPFAPSRHGRSKLTVGSRQRIPISESDSTPFSNYSS
jgi:hypothetical protein